MLDIACETTSGSAVLAPVGRIDATSAAVFESTWQNAVCAGAKLVILDFSGVQYISSAGLRSLLLLGKTLKDQGGALRVANLTGMVAQVFELSGFTALFPAYDSVAGALR